MIHFDKTYTDGADIELRDNVFVTGAEDAVGDLIHVADAQFSMKNTFVTSIDNARRMGILALIGAPRGAWRRCWHAIARFALRRAA